MRDAGITGNFEVSIVQEFGPELLIHSKKTIPGHRMAQTPAEVSVQSSESPPPTRACLFVF